MKLAVIFSVLLVQTSASFFSEFSSTVSSVGSSISQLITDTAVDLKDTFDCTVFAVRIAITGANTIPGYEKCQTNATLLSPSIPLQVIITPIAIPISTDGSTTVQPTTNEETNLKMTSSNNTNEDEIANKQSRRNDSLVETRIIVNISKKLESEYEDLSKHVKDDLTKIEREQKQFSTEKVVKENDKLLQEEAVYKNNTDSEIREISDKVTAKLDKNNTDKIDFKKEIKLALAELEHNKNHTNVERELRMWKEEELKELNDIRNLLMNQAATKVINKRTIQTVPTTSIKPTETMPNTTPMTSTTTVPTSKVTKKRHTRRKRPKSMRRSTTTKAPSLKPTNGYDALEKRDKSALHQALKLVDSSKKSAAIMASVLKNKESGTSIFER